MLRLDGNLGAALRGRMIVQVTEIEAVDYQDSEPLNLTRDNPIKRPRHRRVVADAERARVRAGLV